MNAHQGLHLKGGIVLPGHKPMKDRQTILQCGDTFAVFKVKPLLVYHTDNCAIFQKNIMKRQLPVMWW